MSFLLLSIITGLITSSLIREFSFRSISGYSLLALGGALYSEFIYMFLNEIYSITNTSLHSLMLILGMVSFIGIKLAFMRLQGRLFPTRLSTPQ